MIWVANFMIRVFCASNIFVMSIPCQNILNEWMALFLSSLSGIDILCWLHFIFILYIVRRCCLCLRITCHLQFSVFGVGFEKILANFRNKSNIFSFFCLTMYILVHCSRYKWIGLRSDYLKKWTKIKCQLTVVW